MFILVSTPLGFGTVDLKSLLGQPLLSQAN